MKSLAKLMLVLGACFAMTFVALRLSGYLTADQVEGWLRFAGSLSAWHVSGIVVVLLFADLFIAVPTLTITLLAGYFLGASGGAIAALCGMGLASATGYGLSRRYGDRLALKLLGNETELAHAKVAFQQSGFLMVLLSRAVPMLPEVTSCMAGVTRMSLAKFGAAWVLSSVPYAVAASYAGSISSLEDPRPAIFAAIGIIGLLWLAWFSLLRKRTRMLLDAPTQPDAKS